MLANIKKYTSVAVLLSVQLGLPVATYAADDTAELKAQVEQLRKEVRDANEWRRSESLVHLAGYGAATYTDAKGQNGAFSQAQFSPIFHYQYRDLLMLESELEISATSEGETETALEYLALDLFVNDYLTVVAGKFLSPIGQFRQNLHPTWINKMPSHPPGFGEEGAAAPVSDVGAELRGGFPLGRMRANYALYVGNGPELEADAGELEAIEAEGRTRDADGKKVIGGRFGILPIPHLEFGVSAASGKTAVTKDGGVEIADDPERDYDVVDADLTWQIGNFDVRGEYVRQKIGDAAASVAPEGAEWKAWYTQVAYKFLPAKWELVLRRANFKPPHADLEQRQTALGINYLFASNVIAKLAFESNKGEPGEPTDDDRVQLQLAYGF